MKMQHAIRLVIFGVSIFGLAACTSTRHGGAGSPVSDANAMGAGANGAYAEGAGGSSGFQPGTSCNVPQTAGFNTEAFYFEFDRSDVGSGDMNRLQSIAQNASGSHSTVRVVGNTDQRGSREYNIALGWRRANAVSSLLEQNGISKNQITTDSNGAEKPIAFGASDEDYQCNRRVDIISH